MSGNSTLDHQQAALSVDCDNLQVLGGNALGSVVTRHALALEDLTRVGAHTDRTRTAPCHTTVSHAAATEVVALHDTGKAAALAVADDVDHVTDLEGGGCDL